MSEWKIIEKMEMAQGLSEYLDRYIEYLAAIEVEFRRCDNTRMPNYEVVKLFDIVFKKVNKSPAICVLKANDNDVRYDVWVSRGIGVRNRWASRSSSVTEISEIIAMKDQRLCAGLRNVGLSSAAVDMADFTAMLPRFDGKKMFIEVPEEEQFEVKAKDEKKQIRVTEVVFSASYWGGVHIGVCGPKRMEEQELMWGDKGALAAVTNAEFAEVIMNMTSLMKDVGVPSKKMKMAGWENGIIVTELFLQDGVWRLRYMQSEHSSISIEHISSSTDVAAIKKVMPLLPFLLEQVKVQAAEYVVAATTIEEKLRKRFSKQVLAESL